jgi:hypothetical protein
MEGMLTATDAPDADAGGTATACACAADAAGAYAAAAAGPWADEDAALAACLRFCSFFARVGLFIHVRKQQSSRVSAAEKHYQQKEYRTMSLVGSYVDLISNAESKVGSMN